MKWLNVYLCDVIIKNENNQNQKLNKVDLGEMLIVTMDRSWMIFKKFLIFFLYLFLFLLPSVNRYCFYNKINEKSIKF